MLDSEALVLADSEALVDTDSDALIQSACAADSDALVLADSEAGLLDQRRLLDADSEALGAC